MINFKKISSFLWFNLLFITAFAQVDIELAKTKELYPNAQVVGNKYQCEINIILKDGKPVIQYSNLEEFYFLGDNNSGYSNRSIHYSSFYNLKKYEAFALVADNNKYKKVVVKDFKATDFTNSSIFHDDSKELKFMFQRIGAGDKTNISYEYEITDPHLMPSFSISPFLDYLNISFKITYPEGINISVDTFFMGKSLLNYKVEKSGRTNTLSWTGSSKKLYNYESDGPEKAYLAPQIHIRINSYKKDGKLVNVLSNLDDLYAWNCSLTETTKEEIASFKSLSDSIVGSEKDPYKKASLIYSWVQDNIRYIAIEAGYDGLIPAKASEVCKERYGDCKGMSNILFYLLRAQGLEANLTWIGTRDLPFKYTQLPTPAVDNHMITTLKINGQILFLDGTSNNLKFGMPSPFIQGKEALVSSMNCKDYSVQVVPEVSAKENLSYDSCYMKIVDRKVIGSGIITLHGYRRLSFVDRMTPNSYRDLLEQGRYYLIKGSNKFILDTIWLENLNNKNLPLKIYYKFQIPDYALKLDNEIYLNLNLDKSFMPLKIDLTRDVAVEYRYKTSEYNVYCLELGANMVVADLPNNVSFNQANYTFKNSYKKEQQLLVRTQEVAKESLLLETNQFTDYNKFIETMQKSYSQQITLKTK